jgi:flagellar biosynthesis protein FlhF
MELKTYRAHSMADALSEVKKDLGKDAVILHARTFKIGGVMGVGARTMVEITASSDQRAPGPRARGSGQQPTSGAVTGATGAGARGEPTLARSAAVIPAVARAYAAPEQPAPSVPLRTGVDVGAIRGRSADVARAQPEAPETRSNELPRTRVKMNPVDESARASLEAELASIKRLVGEVLEISKRGPAGESRSGGGEAELGVPLSSCVNALRRHGVAQVWIDELIERVRADGAIGGSEAGVSRAIRGVLGTMIPITTVSDEAAGRRGRPLVVALIGPTGVGKTTTIAKLAADLALRRGKRVALIAADTYRIAAVEQIKTYAGIIGLTVEVVHGPDEMAEAMARTRDYDVVLIDTAGRSQRDTDRLDELAEVLAAAEPDRVHLVLSATAAEPVILEAAAAFNALRPTSIAFTKLDEAVLLGSLVNVPRALGMGVTYLTNGQDVPDNIEPATGERIATMLLGHERRGVLGGAERVG